MRNEYFPVSSEKGNVSTEYCLQKLPAAKNKLTNVVQPALSPSINAGYSSQVFVKEIAKKLTMDFPAAFSPKIFNCMTFTASPSYPSASMSDVYSNESPPVKGPVTFFWLKTSNSCPNSKIAKESTSTGTKSVIVSLASPRGLI